MLITETQTHQTDDNVPAELYNGNMTAILVGGLHLKKRNGFHCAGRMVLSNTSLDLFVYFNLELRMDDYKACAADHSLQCGSE